MSRIGRRFRRKSSRAGARAGASSRSDSHRHGTTSSSSAPALTPLRADGVAVGRLYLGQRRGIVGDVDEPRLDAAQQLEELAGLARRQLGQRVVDRRLGDAPDALVHALGLGGEVDPIDAPVAGLGAALDPALGLQAVDQPADRRLLDLHHVGKLGLGGARTPVQPGQRQPLRACQAEPAHAPVEHRAHQPRDVGDHEAIDAHRDSPCRIYIVARGRKLGYDRITYLCPGHDLERWTPTNLPKACPRRSAT